MGGKQSPTPHKDYFCKSSKADEKNWGYRGMTSLIIFEFQPKFVTSGFQKLDLTYIFIQLLNNFILNLFFVLCDAIRFIIGYSNQIVYI